jgi:hypothetical protein
VDHKFKLPISVEALTIIWSLWLCRNDKDVNNKKVLSSKLLPVHYFSLFMAVSSTRRESHLIFAGVYTVGGR